MSWLNYRLLDQLGIEFKRKIIGCANSEIPWFTAIKHDISCKMGLTMATRMVLGSSSDQTLDLSFLKFKKPYIDFTVSFGSEGLLLTGKIHGNFH